MDAKEEALALFNHFKGHNIVFGVAHFEVISVVVKLVDRGRYEVLVVKVKPEHSPNGKSGLEPTHSWRGYSVAYEVSY